MLQNTACFPSFLFHGYVLQGFFYPLRKQQILIPWSVRPRGCLHWYLSHSWGLWRKPGKECLVISRYSYCPLTHSGLCFPEIHEINETRCTCSKPAIVLLLSVQLICSIPTLRNMFWNIALCPVMSRWHEGYKLDLILHRISKSLFSIMILEIRTKTPLSDIPC